MASRDPLARFRVLGLTAVDLGYRVSTEVDEDAEHHPGSVRWIWDWKVSDPGEVEVVFGLEQSPSDERPEQVKVVFVGRFAYPRPIEPEALRRFTAANAPATIIPYLREALSSLTARGPYGSRRLPLFNALSLSKSLPQENASGWKQIQEFPELLEAPAQVESESDTD